MSTFFPKRVKDLPPLEPDSEDDRTPAKRPSAEPSIEMFGALIPKRVSELPPLESDSDDDENDRLNCAVLNDSFILSPNEQIPNTPGDPLKENDKNQLNKGFTSQIDDTLSQKINGLSLDDSCSNKTSRRCSIKPRQALLPLLEETINDKGPPEQNKAPYKHDVNSTHDTRSEDSLELFKNLPIRTTAFPTPKETINGAKNGVDIAEVAKEEAVETPYKTADQNFVTPQIKSFQMPASRRARLFNTNTSQKSRSVLENEFRSQKILFRTPIAVSRPPITNLSNDSISLSLDDTIKGNKTKENLSPVREISKPAEVKKIENEKDFTIINGKEYVILKKIGCGGSSSVFLAQRTDQNLECALKIVDLRGDRAVVEGYLNETRLLAKLQGNVNVVALYEYEHLSAESKLYMVMEKGDSDLHKILQSYKTDLPLYTLMKFWYQMLESVNYIHQNGVIHSDLKPANFLMVNDRLKLIDFGIASNISIDSTSIIKFSQAGTYNYISPEALIDTSTGNSPFGKNVPKIKISTKSDVWSLGCILYLLLYRKTPFGHIKNIYAKVSEISNPKTEIEFPKLPTYYPSMLVDMARKCLVHNPKKRLSVAELLQYPFNMVIPLEKDQDQKEP